MRADFQRGGAKSWAVTELRRSAALVRGQRLALPSL